MPLGVGLSQAPRGLERRAFADAGEDVGERAPLGRMHQRVVGRDQRRADLARERRAPREPPAHVLAISQTRADPQALAEGLAQASEERALPPPSGRVARARAACGGALARVVAQLSVWQRSSREVRGTPLPNPPPP